MNKDTDFTAFCKLLNAAAEVTGAKPKSPDAVKLMFDLLARFSFAQVQGAVRAHFNSDEGRFFPTPTHLIKQIEGSEAERAQVAWRVFLKAIELHGYYDSVRFPDPAFHYAVEMLGGWMRISQEYGNLTTKELDFKRASFCTLYMRGAKVATWDGAAGTRRVSPYLMGFYEISNRDNGYMAAIPPVMEATTHRKSAAVLEAGTTPQTKRNDIAAALAAKVKEAY